MATTAIDAELQRERTVELPPLPAALTRNGKGEGAKRPDIFERSAGAGAAPRTARPSVPYASVGEELERRSREWTAMVRLLEQNRHALDCAEMERDAAYDELARIVSVVQHTARELKEAMEHCKQGELGADLAGLSAKNGKALEDLEKIAVTLNSHFLWCRSAWEQYAKTIVSVQRYRTEVLRG